MSVEPEARGEGQREARGAAQPAAREAAQPAARRAEQPPARGNAPAPQACEIIAADGRALSGHWFRSDAAARRAVLLLNTATGFPQTYYFNLAGFAAGRGYDTLVYDYRGMGFSAPGDLRGETASMSDWGLLDMRAALDVAARAAHGLPVATVGHSVGGQFLGLLKNHALARAHVQIATSVGYWRWERAPFRYLAWWFWRVHGPLMLALKGYVPSGGGWKGLPLPRNVYLEWRRWCLRTDHFGPDLATYLSDNVFSEIRAPLLNIGFDDDPIATRRTVAELSKFFPNAAHESRWYVPRDVGLGSIGHGGFFSTRFANALWAPMFDWLDEKLGVRR